MSFSLNTTVLGVSGDQTPRTVPTAAVSVAPWQMIAIGVFLFLWLR